MTLVTEQTTKETSDGDLLEFELQQLNVKKAAFLQQEISSSLKIFFPSQLRRSNKNFKKKILSFKLKFPVISFFFLIKEFFFIVN